MQHQHTLTPPFPYTGGKRRVAPIVWEIFGDPNHYVEPFAGGLGVLLGRPQPFTGISEVVNDKDGYLINTWRAIKGDPEALAMNLIIPESEIEVMARRVRLKERAEGIRHYLEAHPCHYDTLAAADWLYVHNMGIHGAAMNGPWGRQGGTLAKQSNGVKRGTVDWVSGAGGVNHRGILYDDILEWLGAISQRLQRVAIANRDWEELMTPRVLTRYGNNRHPAIFLDPPYATGNDLYDGRKNSVAKDVNNWCTNRPKGAKIILCGEETEHDNLLDLGWSKIDGVATTSGRSKTDRSHKEKMWLSPESTAAAAPNMLL